MPQEESRGQKATLKGVLLQVVTLGMRRVSPSHLPELIMVVIIGVVIVLLAPAMGTVQVDKVPGVLAVIGLVILLGLLFRLASKIAKWVFNAVALVLVAVFAAVVLMAATGYRPAPPPMATLFVQALAYDERTKSDTFVTSGSVVLVHAPDYSDEKFFGRDGIARFERVPALFLKGGVRVSVTPKVVGYAPSPQDTATTNGGMLQFRLKPIPTPPPAVAPPRPPTFPGRTMRPIAVKPILIPPPGSLAREAAILIAAIPGAPPAALYIDGEHRGLLTSSGRRYVLAVGRHHIEIKARGCATWSDDISVKAGETRDLAQQGPQCAPTRKQG